MTRRNIIIGIVAVLAILGIFAYRFFQGLSFPSSIEAGVSFQTISSTLPEDSGCLNESGEAGLAKELINLQERVVVVGKGANEMPDSEWADYKPRFPWQKNINRNTTFNDSCFYRSPTAPASCQGEACGVTREVSDYDWIDLSIIASQDCLPSPDAGCSTSGVKPGAISVTVTQKCHQVIWHDEIYDLVDTKGNHYVMHATDTGTPNLNAAIPEGWTLTKVALDEPLVVNPFGGGDNCYHNVLRDNLGQGYHQYVFAEESYP